MIHSGNGSDGVQALHSIKAVGGVTFAQDETSAQHPAMPRAAVADGNVDYVLRPRDIRLHLEPSYAHHTRQLRLMRIAGGRDGANRRDG